MIISIELRKRMKAKIQELSEEKKREQLRKQQQYRAIENYLTRLPDDPDVEQLLAHSGKRLVFLKSKDGIVLNSQQGRRRVHALACSSEGLEEYGAPGPHVKKISYRAFHHLDDTLAYIHALAQERGVKIKLAEVKREVEAGIEELLR